MALSPQFYVTDASGKSVAYIKQKLFKLKEDVSVFSDESQSKLLYKIKANKWLDWSASYAFTDEEGKALGRVSRQGRRSLFKARYELFDLEEKQDLIIEEDSFLPRLLDALVGEVPILGFFTGYIFNPKYNITRPDGTMVAQFIKNPSMIGRKFQVNKLTEFEEGEEKRIILGLMMMVLLERNRG